MGPPGDEVAVEEAEEGVIIGLFDRVEEEVGRLAEDVVLVEGHDRRRRMW